MSLSVLRHPGLTWTIDGSDTKGRESGGGRLVVLIADD